MDGILADDTVDSPVEKALELVWWGNSCGEGKCLIPLAWRDSSIPPCLAWGNNDGDALVKMDST